MIENPKKNEPAIRFQGFTDPWEQRKFSEVFVGLQNNTLSRADLNYDQGDIKNVHYGDVLIKYSEYIDVGSAELPYINDSSIESKFAKSLLEDGDIIIADTAEDETVGKCCEITNTEGVKLLSGLHTIAVRPQQKYASKFLGYYLNSSAYHSQLLPLMQGIKVTSISKGALQDTVLTVPTSIDEQGKIGECLSNIDDIITLHQRKCDELKFYKKGLLQHMFPQPGESFPRVRFLGFTDPWEQRKLGSLGSFKNGMNFSKDAMDKGYPFVNLQNIFGKNVIDIENLGLAEATDNQLKEYSLQEGDVLFVRSSVKLEGVGEAAIVPKSLENTTYSGFIIRFRDEVNMDKNFKRFVFGTKPIRNQIMAKATNSANKNISQDVLYNLEVYLPPKEEQHKIGAYLAQLDNLITLYQRKCDELREYKKGLLQKLFV